LRRPDTRLENDSKTAQISRQRFCFYHVLFRKCPPSSMLTPLLHLENVFKNWLKLYLQKSFSKKILRQNSTGQFIP